MTIVRVVVPCPNDSRATLHQAGKIAAREAIATAGQVRGESIRIEKDPRGKPYGRIGSGLPIALSISHSFPFALATATAELGVALGADVERIRDFAPTTWEAFLTSAEKEIVAAARSEKRNELRTLCWSLKESVLKALGTGLRMHPAQIDISRALARRSHREVVISIQGTLHTAHLQWWKIDEHTIATSVALPTFYGYNDPIAHRSLLCRPATQ
ncbi:MAG: 4'-phosphopantetheinyl transferase family protein [Minisyncoccota bacterium]